MKILNYSITQYNSDDVYIDCRIEITKQDIKLIHGKSTELELFKKKLLAKVLEKLM